MATPLGPAHPSRSPLNRSLPAAPSQKNPKIDRTRAENFQRNVSANHNRVEMAAAQVMTDDLERGKSLLTTSAHGTHQISAAILQRPLNIQDIENFMIALSQEKGHRDFMNTYYEFSSDQKVFALEKLLSLHNLHGPDVLRDRLTQIDTIMRKGPLILLYDIMMAEPPLSLPRTHDFFLHLHPAQKKLAENILDRGDELVLVNSIKINYDLYKKSPKSFFKTFEQDCVLRDQLKILSKQLPVPTISSLLEASNLTLTPQQKKALSSLTKNIPIAYLDKHLLDKEGHLDSGMMRTYLLAGQAMRRPFRFKTIYFPREDGEFNHPSFMLTKNNQLYVTREHINSGSFKHIKGSLHLNVDNTRVRATVKAKGIKDTKKENEVLRKFAQKGSSQIFAPFHDVIEVKGKLVMMGEKFDDRGTKLKDYPLKQKFHGFRQMAQGLDAMHQEGYVHNDMKPSNTLIKGKPDSLEPIVLVISDLGGAEKIGSKQDIFSIPYMAAEGISDSDPKKDAWAFGVSMLEILAGGANSQIKIVFKDFSGDGRKAKSSGETRVVLEKAKEIILYQLQEDGTHEDEISLIMDFIEQVCRPLLLRNPDERMSVHDALPIIESFTRQ